MLMSKNLRWKDVQIFTLRIVLTFIIWIRGTQTTEYHCIYPKEGTHIRFKYTE